MQEVTLQSATIATTDRQRQQLYDNLLKILSDLQSINSAASLIQQAAAGTYGSASAVPIIVVDSNKNITSITTTPIVILPGAITVGDGKIIVGNAANVGVAVSMTGDIAITNTGVTSYNGVVPITKGGTGQITATLGFNALSPLTTLGDIIYHDGTNNGRLAGQITSTRKFLRQTGTGLVSGVPAWDTIVSADIPLSAGAILAGNISNVAAEIADVAVGSVLVSGGVGVAPAYSSSPTISTSITCPLFIGGTAVGSSLILRSTSGVGTTDSIIFQVGNNGATEVLKLNNNGSVSVGNNGSNNAIFFGHGVGFNAAVNNYNHVFGVNALSSLTTGFENIAIGFKALNTNTTGFRNVAIGHHALRLNVSSGSNVAVGGYTLERATGNNNTAIGHGAGSLITTGSNNTCIGGSAGAGISTTSNNVAIGISSMSVSNTASETVAVGYQSLQNITSGASNTAVGRGTLQLLTTGSRNSAFGQTALISLTTNSDCSAFGNNSLVSTTGGFNTAVGSWAGNATTIGTNNVYLGYSAGRFQTTASNQLIIDGINRTTLALELTNALVIGSFNSIVASQDLTIPLIIGGTAVGSSLTLRSTSGVGTTDSIIFQVGNNGATERMKIDLAGVYINNLTSGRVPFATTNGRLTDDADFTFLTDTLTVTKFGATELTGNMTCTARLLVPMAEVSYFDTTGTTITIAAASDGSTNMVVCNPATTLDNDLGFDNGGSNNGRLRHTGTVTKKFHIACTVSITSTSANDTFVMGLAKNGTVDPNCKVIQKITTSGDTQSTSLHCMMELATNDYVEMYVGNMTDADDFIIKTLNIFAMGM